MSSVHSWRTGSDFMSSVHSWKTGTDLAQTIVIADISLKQFAMFFFILYICFPFANVEAFLVLLCVLVSYFFLHKISLLVFNLSSLKLFQFFSIPITALMLKVHKAACEFLSCRMLLF